MYLIAIRCSSFLTPLAQILPPMISGVPVVYARKMNKQLPSSEAEQHPRGICCPAASRLPKKTRRRRTNLCQHSQPKTSRGAFTSSKPAGIIHPLSPEFPGKSVIRCCISPADMDVWLGSKGRANQHSKSLRALHQVTSLPEQGMWKSIR